MKFVGFIAICSAAVASLFGESFEAVELRECLKPGPSPMDAKPVVVQLEKCGNEKRNWDDGSALLDGEWKMVEDNHPYSESIPCKVPGSVHCALMVAGKLADPYVGCNDLAAQNMSFRDWNIYRDFTVDEATAKKKLRLEFGGVCNVCRVYLNGEQLGPKHEGMFGGPDYDVTGKIKPGKNHIEVWLERIPEWSVVDGFGGIESWRGMVVFNCCYGWHYAQIPALGIWQSVKLRPVPEVEIEDPFIATVSLDGTMDFFTRLRNVNSVTKGVLECVISPLNFEGPSWKLSAAVQGPETTDVRYRFKIPDPQLWWPNGSGDQNLYTMSVRFRGNDGTVTDVKRFNFGIRTIEMRPIGKSSPDKYDWKFVINGVEMFMKGTGWCTTDALMRFTDERYDRFLGIAKLQNINFVRAWGCGLVETDRFYDLCDKYGICVMQEWPTAWDSYLRQPREVLEETVERGVKRLRNRASLIMWCGGNEGKAPLKDCEFKVANLNMIGRRTLELDGTRPWHRQEGDARGSRHEYCSSWGRKNVAELIKVESEFLGEFGIDSFPCMESIRKYAPDLDMKSVAHHTPKFGERDDMSRLSQHSWMFLPTNSFENLILGSQLAQGVGLRHILERARTRFPECGGACMYKLNDLYPAASWSTVDWYGVEKYASSVVADSFAPQTAIAIFDKLCVAGESLEIPLYVVDDANTLTNWKATLRVYDSEFKLIRSFTEGPVKGLVNRFKKVGTYKLSAEETKSVPLWVVADLEVNSKLAGRNFYYLNFEEKQGCLFSGPKTKVEMSKEGDVCVFKNCGNVSAVNVHFVCPAHSDTFSAEDNYFWLDPGEVKRVKVNHPSDIESVAWWNK